MQAEPSYTPLPLILHEGYILDLKYDDVEEMERDDDNWEHHCNYQLLPGALQGHHRVVQLHAMQIALAHRPNGGMMFDAGIAKGCITIGLLETCSGKVSFERVKLRAGDIVSFDDTQRYRFVSSGAFNVVALSISTERLEAEGLLPKVSKALLHVVRDTDGILSRTLHGVWNRFSAAPGNIEKDAVLETEDLIFGVLRRLFAEQTPCRPRLSIGEQRAFAVRDKVLQHMDGTFSVATLAKEFQISEKTLQNSFKSLFGFTPARFLRNLKLNHVHRELKHGDPKCDSVSRIAQKWGFSQMGHFSKYYKALFGESPSETLRSTSKADGALQDQCVSRQEEME